MLILNLPQATMSFITVTTTASTERILNTKHIVSVVKTGDGYEITMTDENQTCIIPANAYDSLKSDLGLSSPFAYDQI